MSTNTGFILGNLSMLVFLVICWLGARAVGGIAPPEVKPSTPARGTRDYRETHAKFLKKHTGDQA